SGIENPAFDGGGGGGGGGELSPVPHPGRGETRGDTLAAHPKKTQLQTPADEKRGNEHSQNYFDPPSAEQTDPRQSARTGVNAEDELELMMLRADETRLYHRMAALLDEDSAFVDLPGTVLASRDGEVLEVKAGDLVLQRRLLLHAGAGASGSGPSQVHSTAKTAAKTGDGLGDRSMLRAGRMVMGTESTRKGTQTAEDVIPRYTRQLRERVRPDMITLGSLSLQQVRATKTIQYVRKRKLAAFFTGNFQACSPVCVHLCAFTCVCSPVCVHLCVHLCAFTCVRSPVCVHLCAFTCVRSPVCVHLCVHLCAFTCVCSPLCVHLCVHLCSPVCVHLCAFTCVCLNTSYFTSAHFQVVPAPAQVVPSMVLVFELVALPGLDSHVGSVLGWGAFPVCDSAFSVVQGRFKTPLLRGEPKFEFKPPDFFFFFFFYPPLVRSSFRRTPPLPPPPPRLSVRTRLALRTLPSELGFPSPWQQSRSWRGSVGRPGLIMLLLALMWFARLYLHYSSQWLYLQAIAVPVNKFVFHAHTVELVYQSSLLHTREELAVVALGPLTLNAVTLTLVLIRWACQHVFGSLPSFTSKLIMAQGVWTVLDPLAVFAVDALLGRLVYTPDTPVGDAAKLYWHFYRIDQSGVSGVVLTLFLYSVLTVLSLTVMFIYLLRYDINYSIENGHSFSIESELDYVHLYTVYVRNAVKTFIFFLFFSDSAVFCVILLVIILAPP
uniref:Uncharacterized protein n=1 Tax=Periophthalmus magnuspinnatus TaxID=409849 RepID=A0A3B4B564_9GOBI